METVSVPNGSAGDSHAVPATPRGLRALAPTLFGTGSLSATPGYFAVTAALCTSWPHTRGVKVGSPPCPRSLALTPQHRTPTSLARLGQGGQRLLQSSGPGWGKAALSRVGFPSPCCQAQGSTGRQGGRAPGQRSCRQRGGRGKARDRSRPCSVAAGVPEPAPGSPHLLLTYCLPAAFFELTSAGEAPPATPLPPARGVCSQTRQRAGKGAQGPLQAPGWPDGTWSPLHPEMLGCSQACPEHLLASLWLSSLPKFLSVTRLHL